MTTVDPCSGNLSDHEYLEHMIPHHQVAIDMSELLIPSSNNPTMLHLCRDIIRKQSYEIWEMNMVKDKLIQTVFADDESENENFRTKLDVFNPIMSKSDEECNPMFFKPNDHSNMMKNMKVTDQGYLEHMIPHHQVAVDMSKRLLLHTNNSYLLDFCRKLIIDQQYEILLMNDLLKSIHNLYKSELLDNDDSSFSYNLFMK